MPSDRPLNKIELAICVVIVGVVLALAVNETRARIADQEAIIAWHASH
jgi:hypothetical protein